MINCLIVDDEPLAQEILAAYINADERLCLVEQCSMASAAFEQLQNKQIDLMFLDVKMPGMDGITFLSALKAPPAVIFTTAFLEYAALSYDLEAVDYLLKPITNERFQKSLDKYFKQQPIKVQEDKSYTYFKVNGRLLKVPHAEILYAQSIGDYIMLYTQNGNHMVHMTMKYLSTLLPAHSFIRLHRSYLVNGMAVAEISKNGIRINDTEIPVGERYRNSLSRLKEMHS
ncbi:LytTR family DNA-binding domain-containing protein [Pedobacter aquatilis]|uniref:LytR/AlgR family response regulator transcription factor n=1 Tax=Pedobacter aquatilis TaxID=351343 RepID=UPI00292E0491|nr:LytTR family DNA-binding domain-containing protein [Pedobacter aquatilis]